MMTGRGEALASYEVSVPGTTANLGPGFDTLGLALSIYDRVVFSVFDDAELEITVEGSGAEGIPTDASNLLYRSIKHVFDSVGAGPIPGLRIEQFNGVPSGRGLGSSASAVVTGILIARTLLAGTHELSDEDLLRFANDVEGHADNIAPALFGGMTIAWVEDAVPHHLKLDVNRAVLPVVFVPDMTLSTEYARSLAPKQVSREDAVYNIQRSALLIAALIQRPNLLFEATGDKLHQDHRAPAMPASYALIQALRKEGLAAVVSGAGPTVLVLADGPVERQRALDVAAEFERTATGDERATWTPMMLAVDVLGGRVKARAGE